MMSERDCRLRYEYEDAGQLGAFGWESWQCYWWCMHKMLKGREPGVRGMQKLAAEKSLAERESR